MNPVQKLKRNIALNPTPYFTAATAVGFGIGVMVTAKYIGPVTIPSSTSECFDRVMAECAKEGLALFAFDAAQQAKWAACQ